MVLGFLSAGVCAQNPPVLPVSGVPPAGAAPARPEPKQEQKDVSAPAELQPNLLQADPGVPELGTVAAHVKAAVPEVAVKPAAPASIEEMKMKQGQAMAELKKKQQEELRQLKEQMKASSSKEIHKAVETKKKGYKEAVKFLKDIQKKEMNQFRKDHPELVKNIKKTDKK